MSRYSVIFARFLRRKMAIARASVADIRSDSLVGCADSLATYTSHTCFRLYSRPMTSRARVALLHLLTPTCKRFAFWLRGPIKLTCPSSRFKISSDGKIDMDSLYVFLRFVLCALAGFSMDEEAWSQLPGGHYFPIQNGLKIH